MVVAHGFTFSVVVVCTLSFVSVPSVSVCSIVYGVWYVVLYYAREPLVDPVYC